jgi:hypothetical protein
MISVEIRLETINAGTKLISGTGVVKKEIFVVESKHGRATA